MKSKVLFLALSMLIIYSVSYSSSEYDYEIIVMFAENVVQMPVGVSSASIEQVSFRPQAIKDLFLMHHARTISKAFPNFDLADTILESPIHAGVFARQARLDWIYKITLDDSQERDVLNLELSAFAEVYFAEKNGVGELFIIPNDPDFGLQWNMNNTDNPLADINAPEAWDKTQGNPDAIIGIVDNGVDMTHSEFYGRISGEGPIGPNSHATHLAGIAAAQGFNQAGIAGVTWNSQIYSTGTDVENTQDVYNSIIDAVLNAEVDVINCS